ncbi:MAG: T9SS type A sorting domain-containing protein [FCB group bacterium]|nr:T9SS type A sorting domain-containing protein [FCB group bacterium]
MKGFKLLFITIASLGLVLSGPKLAPRKVSAAFHPQVEPAGDMNLNHGEAGPILMPNSRNAMSVTLVDSSKNGYGLIVSPTKPLSKTAEGWIMGYRQWAGANGTSGQIGAAYSPDGASWTTYTNLNPGMGIGRYPSALGTPDYPYVFWNEYTGEGVGYGGRPYYAYDEFGWDGGSFSEAYDVDALWGNYKDLWVLSPEHNYDAANDMHVFNIAMDDWTRNDIWLFHSEAYDDGYIIFGDEIKVINEVEDLVGGDASGSYTSQAIVDINDDGIGYVAVTAYFAGAQDDPPSSQYTNAHTLIFKGTDNYGATWSGGQDGSPYYFVDDDVLNQMVADGLFPSSWTDSCPPYDEIVFDDLFFTYDFDLKVDSNGNPHFVVGVIMSAADGVYPGMPGNAWLHLTIDKDYLANPGTPGTATGWNYSVLMPTDQMWRWENADGESYWQGTFPSLQFSEDDENVMWVVVSGPDPGDFVVTDNGGTPDDECDDLGLFPEWNEEVFVLKSMDMGQTWWCQYNATQTVPDCWVDENGDYQCADSEICPDGSTQIVPDEVNAHAGFGATNDMVPVIYQSPDWCYGSTTDGSLSAQNHKNRLYVGSIELTTEDMTECGIECPDMGDVNDDGAVDILDIVSILNYILLDTPLTAECAGDFNGDGAIDILDIVSIVNMILGNAKAADATEASVIRTDNSVSLIANGFVGAVEMTLRHGPDFSLQLTENALAADYNTDGNTTKLIVVGLNGSDVFTSDDQFEITEVKAASGSSYLNIAMADEFALLSNYPNPFNPETSINYTITKEGPVELAIYNLIGEKVATLIQGNSAAGAYSTVWNGTDDSGQAVSSGVYLVQLKLQNEVVTNKITLLR